MAGDASAYAALGLPLGADSASVERAYKRLIKEHHPDRAGGDARRAAEINRAYRELRAGHALGDPLELIDEDSPAQRRSAAWVGLTFLVSLAGLAMMLAGGSLEPVRAILTGGAGRLGSPLVRRPASDPMDQPLHLTDIENSVQRALQLVRTSDEMRLASASGDCHRELRRKPSILLLDRCAAFDDAVVQLQDRDPLRDQGPFGELAVTGRIWSGASALSQDSVAIDSRLDRIRLRVEISLAPFLDQPKQPAAGAAN